MRLPYCSARLTAGDRSSSRLVAEGRGYADEQCGCMVRVFEEAGGTTSSCVPDVVALSAGVLTLITSALEKFRKRIIVL